MFIAVSIQLKVFTTSYFSSWEELEQNIRNCTRCLLHKSRRNIVLGEGSRNSPIMIIGEAPGATEDDMGRPFVGAAGKLLTLTLESIGIRREDTYITNVVKCRPPQNREPKDDEIESCSIFLESQILLIKPKVIVTLGNIAGKKVFSLASRPWSSITKMRGRIHVLNILGLDIHVVPTIHPAAALYNPSLRSILLNDLKLAKDLLTSAEVSFPLREEREVQSRYKEIKKDVKTLIDYVKKS